VAEGQAEGLDRRRRRLAASVLRSLISRTAGRGSFPAVSLLIELEAFFTSHHACGGLDAGVTGPRGDSMPVRGERDRTRQARTNASAASSAKLVG
jgi:hypothetical protein